ncbi:hypothetical protein GEMRC1_011368 [Eukaryota sp. GEM-RC1]
MSCNFDILLLNLQNVISEESSKTTVDDHRVYTYLDPLLDELKSGEDATDLDNIIDTLLSVSSLQRWHLTQAATFGLCHVVSYSLSSDYLEKVIAYCIEFLPDLKREVRECSAQLLGAIVAAHPRTLITIAPYLKSHLNKPSVWEPCEGSAMAAGFCIRSLPADPIDEIASVARSLLVSLSQCTRSTHANSYSCYVRLQSLRALARIGSSTSRSLVTEETRGVALLCLGDEDLNVRRIAARAVALLGPDDVTSEGFLLNLSELLSTSSSWRTQHGVAEAIKIYSALYGVFLKPATVRNVASALSMVGSCGLELSQKPSPQDLEKMVVNSACSDALVELILMQSDLSEGGNTECEVAGVTKDFVLPGAHWVSDMYHSFVKPLILKFLTAPFPLLNDSAGRNINSLVKRGLDSSEAVKVVPGLFKLSHHASMPIRDMALRTLNVVLHSMGMGSLSNVFSLNLEQISKSDGVHALSKGKICSSIISDLISTCGTSSFNSNPELKECVLKGFAEILVTPVAMAVIESGSLPLVGSIAGVLVETLSDHHEFVRVAGVRALSSFVLSQGTLMNEEGLGFVTSLVHKCVDDDFDDVVIASADLIDAIVKSLRLYNRKGSKSIGSEGNPLLNQLALVELISPGLAFSTNETIRSRHQVTLGGLLGEFPLRLIVVSFD